MEFQENPVFGRKVFFLNMSKNLQDQFIDRLREAEFEVFALSDFREAKAILRHFPESICFVQIDIHESNQLSTNQWFNFLNSFKNDEILSKIFLGVITKRMTTSEQNFFMLNLPLAAGLLSIRNGTEELFDSLINILEVNGAKGRRKYVRARCPDNSRAFIQCKVGTNVVNMHLNDVSSVGISSYVPNSQASLFTPNLVLSNTTFSLPSTRNIPLSVAVLTTKPYNEEFSLLVLLFLKGTLRSVKSTIRQYVFQVLEKEINKVADMEQRDPAVYSEEINLEEDEGFLLDADNEETQSDD